MNRRTKIAVAVAATVGVVGLGAGGALAATSGDGDEDRQLTGRDRERATAAALEHTGGGEVTDAERDNDESPYEVEVRLDDGREVDVHLDEQFRVVDVPDDDADDRPDDDSDDRDDRDDDRGERALTGRDRERATAAALEHTGGGEVTDAERDNDESPYEVEVRLDDGREVDVHLDEQFRVVDVPDDDADDGDDD